MKKKATEKAYIGLGSNLGDRLVNLQQAVIRLQADPDLTVDTISSLYETEPVGGPDQGSYLNACAELKTTVSPIELLKKILAIENTMGRIRKEKWGPRVIDIDLLVYESFIYNTPLLQLPHPRLAERDFVLVPLAEIAPGLTVPGSNKTVADLLAKRVRQASVTLFDQQGWSSHSWR